MRAPPKWSNIGNLDGVRVFCIRSSSNSSCCSAQVPESPSSSSFISGELPKQLLSPTKLGNFRRQQNASPWNEKRWVFHQNIPNFAQIVTSCCCWNTCYFYLHCYIVICYSEQVFLFSVSVLIVHFIRRMEGLKQQYCLKWNNHKNNISGVFDRLRLSERFVDVTLASADQKSIKCHRILLSAGSG